MKRVQTNLFIGGPMDGTQRVLPPGMENHGRVCFPVMSPRARWSEISQEVAPEFDRAVYRRETLHAGDTLWDVCVFDDMTIQEAMAKLLAGYSPANASGWISVKDRMPATFDMVLVHAPSADPEKPLVHMAYYDALAEKWCGLVPYWCDAITHWQPMPKAPVTP